MSARSPPNRLAGYGGTNRVNAIFDRRQPSRLQPDLIQNRSTTCAWRAVAILDSAATASTAKPPGKGSGPPRREEKKARLIIPFRSDVGPGIMSANERRPMDRRRPLLRRSA